MEPTDIKIVQTLQGAVVQSHIALRKYVCDLANTYSSKPLNVRLDNIATFLSVCIPSVH